MGTVVETSVVGDMLHLKAVKKDGSKVDHYVTPFPLVLVGGLDAKTAYGNAAVNILLKNYHFEHRYKVTTDNGTVSISGNNITLMPANPGTAKIFVNGVLSLTLTIVYPKPNTPSIVVPTDGATAVALTSSLQGSAYSGPVGIGAHAKTHWQIATDANFTNNVVNVESTTNLLTYPLSSLQPATKYYARVRYSN